MVGREGDAVHLDLCVTGLPWTWCNPEWLARLAKILVFHELTPFVVVLLITVIFTLSCLPRSGIALRIISALSRGSLCRISPITFSSNHDILSFVRLARSYRCS